MTNPSSNEWTITVVDGPSFTCDKDKTLLQALEGQGVEILYHCREGFCGACRSRLKDGEVDYTTDPLAFIDDDEILPCCCKAISDVTLEVNP